VSARPAGIPDDAPVASVWRELSVPIVREVLSNQQELAKRELLAALTILKVNVGTTAELNSFLYSHREAFAWSVAPGGSRVWRAVDATGPGSSSAASPPGPWASAYVAVPSPS
jgi:hypothetical protein